MSQAKFDENNYYKWPCNCSEFFGGNSCEIDMRGCGEFSACPDPAMCRNDSTLPSGYACDQCMDGFELSNTKCIGTWLVDDDDDDDDAHWYILLV